MHNKINMQNKTYDYVSWAAWKAGKQFLEAAKTYEWEVTHIISISVCSAVIFKLVLVAVVVCNYSFLKKSADYSCYILANFLKKNGNCVYYCHYDYQGWTLF